MYDEGNSWHDNPMWEDAERRARLLQGEITILRSLVADCQIITRPTDDFRVAIGHRIDFFDARGQCSFVVILGPLDIDVNSNIISYESPLAKSLLGQLLGTDVYFSDTLMTIKRITPWEE